MSKCRPRKTREKKNTHIHTATDNCVLKAKKGFCTFLDLRKNFIVINPFLCLCHSGWLLHLSSSFQLRWIGARSHTHTQFIISAKRSDSWYKWCSTLIWHQAYIQAHTHPQKYKLFTNIEAEGHNRQGCGKASTIKGCFEHPMKKNNKHNKEATRKKRE